MFEPEHLSLWTRPDNYGGHVWPCYYVFMHRNRDSDALTRSNFECALKEIGGESDTVEIVSERHWAVGWVEWIAIHQDDIEALKRADRVMARLADYPVVDEDHYSDLEWDETMGLWENMTRGERIYWLDRAGLSIFAARRAEFPQDDNCVLFDMLRQ